LLPQLPKILGHQRHRRRAATGFLWLGSRRLCSYEAKRRRLRLRGLHLHATHL